jgi:hypothetical protein
LAFDLTQRAKLHTAVKIFVPKASSTLVPTPLRRRLGLPLQELYGTGITIRAGI